MGIKKFKKTLIFMISMSLIVLLSGCFLSEEEALKKATNAAEDAFNNQAKETNQIIDEISLHLPEDMEINGSSNNNVFLEREGQDYLLFYNQIENEKSKHLFESIKLRPDPLLLESFEESDRFGFIAVFPTNKKEQYEIQVGIGGIKKISTITSMENLEKEAKEMMQILRSIQVKK